MNTDIINVVDDILFDFDINHRIFGDDFIKKLEDYGFMIVPIEDPTNLFGIQEDSL